MTKMLGPYHLIDVLGRGGMGTVYRARHEKTGEVCAVKALSPVYAHDDHFRNRFNSEIESLIALDHPNIVRLIGHGQDEGNLFFAMELVDGNSLYKMQRDGHRFDWREVIKIGKDVCKGLRHAHDRGVIHRDLKPGNLLKADDGLYKITDFGIAKRFGASQNTGDNVIGTMDFMSPEQARGKPVTMRSDLYSLGTVMFTLISGKAPFSGNSIEESLRNLTKVPAPRVSDLVPNVPKELDQLIRKLMAKNPEKRIPTALALHGKLDELEQMLRYYAEAQTAARQKNTGETFQIQNPSAEVTSAKNSQATADFADPNKTDVLTTMEVKELELQPLAEDREDKKDYFQQVTPERRRKATNTTEQETATRGSVFPLLIGLFLIIGIAIYGVIVALRPPSANQLYETITAAESPESQRENIALFIKHYSEDERIDEIKQQDLTAKALAEKNRLFAIYNTTGNLSDLQKLFVDNVKLADTDPETAHEKMAAFIALNDGDTELSDDDAKCIETGKIFLALIDTEANRKISGNRRTIQKGMKRAEDKSKSPKESAEIYRSIITTYSDDKTVSDLIQLAKEKLNELGYSE